MSAINVNNYDILSVPLMLFYPSGIYFTSVLDSFAGDTDEGFVNTSLKKSAKSSTLSYAFTTNLLSKGKWAKLSESLLFVHSLKL